jgi:hypothetical protein
MTADEAARLAYGTRHVADLATGAVIDHASRALGPAPAAPNPLISQRMPDLALYVRSPPRPRPRRPRASGHGPRARTRFGRCARRRGGRRAVWCS